MMQLTQFTHILIKHKIDILRDWVKDEEVYSILKTHKISIKVFLKQYAVFILDSYIKTIENKKEILECEVLEEFLGMLKDKGISTSEFFLFFSAFKKSIFYCFNKNELLSFELLKEITNIHEKTFVTVLARYSKRIKDVENRLSKLEDLTHEFIMVSQTDTNGVITNVTQAFCDATGYTKEDLVGNKHNIIKDPDNKKKFYKELWSTITSGKTWHGELRNKKKNGDFFWVDIVIMPQINSLGKVESYNAIYQDITPQKKLQEQQEILIEQSKAAAMGEMISMIAHQWRQPLQAVSILSHKLPLSKMSDGQISDELLKQVVTDISKQLDYMSKTIDDFRDFFIPHKDKEKISIEELIDRTLEFTSFMFKNDNIKVRIKQSEDIRFKLYVNEIIQVLINLLKNARDVLLENEKNNRILNISYYTKEKNAIIEVEDNAGGISEKIIKKIFDPYFSTKDEKNGTGLGLYMCKTIVEKHCHGKLSVKNSELGAVFTIELPMA